MYIEKKGVIVIKIRKEFTKGSTSMLVLSVLSQETMYGYQIIKTLENRSEQVFSLNEGTLYPILHNLEREGLLESYWEHTESARSRKYYRITKKGKLELAAQREEWKVFSQAVERVVREQIYE